MIYERVFTTGQIGKICRVSQQTIIRAFDTQQLKGYKIPGSRFRKVPWNSLHSWMTANKLDTKPIELNVLILNVSNSPKLIELGSEYVRRRNGKPGEVVHVRDTVELGTRIVSFPPAIVVLDSRTGAVTDACFSSLLELKGQRKKMNLPMLILVIKSETGSVSGKVVEAADRLLAPSFDPFEVSKQTVKLLE